MSTLKQIFEKLGGDLPIDASLLRRLRNYQIGFTNRNEAHIAFFGGNLLGVHPVRFRTTDRNLWFDSIVKIDEAQLKTALMEVPDINMKFKVSSDTFNQSCVWLMYAIANSKLSTKEKEDGLHDVALIMQYKLISSIMAHYFPYDAPESVAIATYAELTRKFALKVYGSWGALLNARAATIIGPDSIHYRTYHQYTNDKAVVYMVNDIQGRLREMINSLAEVFHRVHKSGTKFSLVSSTIEKDGLIIIKDRQSSHQTYTRYVKEVINDKPSFIRAELTAIICDAMSTMPAKLFEDTLVWVCDHHSGRYPQIDKLVDGVLNHAYDYITHSSEFHAERVDLPLLLTRLRALYMASRMADVELINAKGLAEEIVSKAVHTKNPSVIASLRTGLQLYIGLRAFAMSYYT